MIDVVKKIATIINKDPEKILLLIQANQNKKAPEKPYATYTELESKLDDTYNSVKREEKEGKVIETAKLYGEYPIQFDIYADTQEEARKKATELWEKIVYKMRYSVWHIEKIGICNTTAPKALPAFLTAKYEYRYMFVITFSYLNEVTREITFVEKIKLTANDKKEEIGG
ncbi:MAG: LIC_12616 family protein [Fusobacterium ulcerans]|uniref:phage neck terminator protein n=1 Tax=Fusobacterium ulcerans TaxID=861 RepID=UPI003A89D6A7